jgi:UDP-N-acetylmuramyl pentapeptide phosphotransferase/UDP-N-acetylglucosamine-1-phosphate transferase
MLDLSMLDLGMLETGGTALVGWVALFFAIGLVGTWLARGYALRHRLLDEPGERRSHNVATPRGGGIAIVAALLVAIGCLILRDPDHAPLLSAIGLGLALVGGIGWADDHRPLPVWLRLAVQGVAAMLLAWGIWHEGGGVWAVVSAIVAAMVLVNVWNFMDGIDGLATSQALIVALGYGLMAGHGALRMLAFAFAAACLGFLPFNMPKARIFLGDVGSGALGYALAALGAWLALRDWARAPMLLLPLSALLVDASLTLSARMVQRQRWWLPHTQHAYQCWARRIQQHGAVTLAYAGWTMAATIFMLATSSADPALIMSTLVATSLGGWLAWAWLRRASRRIGRGDSE